MKSHEAKRRKLAICIQHIETMNGDRTSTALLESYLKNTCNQIPSIYFTYLIMIGALQCGLYYHLNILNLSQHSTLLSHRNSFFGDFMFLSIVQQQPPIIENNRTKLASTPHQCSLSKFILI